MLEWVEQHREWFIWLSIASVVFFVGSLIAVGVVVVRMPVDRFAKKEKAPKGNLAMRIGRNVLGWVLILAGLAMLVLPGQGLLVLLIGIMLADFPGKVRLERWIVSRGKVLKTINKFRKKFGRPPLQMETDRPSQPYNATGADLGALNAKGRGVGR